MDTGLALLPGTSAGKVIDMFENLFGKVRNQSIPCDGGIHTEDLSGELSPSQAFACRSIVGTCLYLARDRPDLLFTVKELSGGMVRSTFTCLQRLKKLVGYLKSTPDLCVMLDIPTGGQGRWRASDKYLVLESFSDSDWSANQTHRRSTSCGVHLLNGSFFLGSSRTQRVVSLSSCESEPHAMISTLSDSIFLRRCLEFVFNAEVEHVMFTEFYRFIFRTSTGDEARYRESEAFIWHNFLWIQDCVRNGDVELSQIPTIWTVSDIGTKSLGVQRVHLPLHELNMASSTDFCVVGGPEYEAQCQCHGGGGKLSKLVKHITRILVLMGLESSTLQGVAAVTMLDDDTISNTGACSGEPNTSSAGGDGFPFFIKFIFIVALVGLMVFLWKTYRLARDAYQSFEQNYTDSAALESLVDRQGQEIRAIQTQLMNTNNEHYRRLREGFNELQGDIEMVSDSNEQVHFGLVQLGGYTPFRPVQANDTQHMYEVERANLVARRTMGTERFMATIKQQNQGQVYGDDADMIDENAESEPA